MKAIKRSPTGYVLGFSKARRLSRSGAGRCLVEGLENRRLLTAYFVSPIGSDANPAGDPAHPWQTIAKLDVTSFHAGDQVLFESGRTFAGNLTFGADDVGTAAAPVVVSTYSYDPLGGAFSVGSGQAAIAAGNGNGILATNTAGLQIGHLNLFGAGQSANSFSGISFSNSQPGNTKLQYVHIDSVEVSGFGKYGITVGGSSGKSGFNDISITNVNVHHNTVGGIETHGVFSGSATGYANTNVYVGHCVAHDNPGYAGATNHTGDGIMLSDVDGAVIERSEAYNNGSANTHVGGPVGIWVWDTNNALIQNNESHHNRTNSKADGGGFDLDGGVTNSIVQYNYSHDNDGPGYGIYQFSGARPFHDNVVRYNISANDARKNGYAAIDFWNGNSRSGISDVAVYNNTVYLAPAASGTPKALRFQTATANVSVRNNIFQTTGGVQLADIQGRQTNLQLQGNDYWTSGSAFSLKVSNKTYTTFSAYVSATGYEKLGSAIVGKNLDPMLSSPSTIPTVGLTGIDAMESIVTGFKLTASSPLRNAGLNLFSQFGINPGTRDFFGNPLPGDGVTDIGAHEYA